MMEQQKETFHERGFALLQLLISLAILSTIAFFSWNTIKQISSSKSKRESSLQKYSMARNAIARILKDLSMAYLSSGQLPGRESTPRTFFEGTHESSSDEVRFTYFGHERMEEDAAEADTAAVAYTVGRDPDDSRMNSLLRTETRRIQEVNPMHLDAIAHRTEVLCEGISQLQIWYYDPIGRRWLNTWRTTQADGFQGRLPSRVAIKLSIVSSNGNEVSFFSQGRIEMFQSIDNSPK